MAQTFNRHLFLTGAPACGKTTLIRRVIEQQPPEVACRGFYTEEVRQEGERIGFDVVTLDGQRAVLARAGCSGKGCSATALRGKPLVGKYAVDLPSFEALALPQLNPAQGVGNMELKSRRFFPAVAQLLTDAQLVLGTLPLPRTGRLIAEVEAVRERRDVEVIHVRRDNRDQLVGEVAAWLAQRLKS